MRKQTKLVAVLSAAALLAIGASMTSFAATPHWDQEDGEWVYLDRNGDKVAGEWKKSNGQWYYLDDDGYMAKDALIEYNDGRYYVDENGVKVTNAWVSMDNDDLLDDDDISTVWFYFDAKGKANGYGKDEGVIKNLSYGDGQKAYFIFNSDGIMLTGWQKHTHGTSEDIYYLGDENEGWARTGWVELDTDDEIFDGGDEDGNPYEDEEWFYFDSKGKAKKSKTESIGGKWYAFDSNGVMLDLWVYGTSSNISNSDGSSTTMATVSDADTARARYHEEDNGGRDKNWIYAYANTDYTDYDDDMFWFYLDSKGRPTIAGDEDCNVAKDYSDSKDGTDRVVVAKSIKNKTYIFDDAGRMRTGLFYLENVKKGSSELNGYYYFTEDDDHSSVEGQMVTNKKVTVEIDGEDETFYFKKAGDAYVQTIISGSLYGLDGRLVNDFGDGSTYEIRDFGYEINTDKAGKNIIAAGEEVLVNGNGKIKKSGTVTDINGLKVTVKDYIVTKKVDENGTVLYEADVEKTETEINGEKVNIYNAVKK